MSPLSLHGRSAIVTGAGTGLGRAEALTLAHLGASVVVNDVSDASQETVAAIEAAGGQAVAVNGDVGQWELGEKLVNTAVSTFGSLDIVVNNAGILRDTLIFNLTEAQWDDVMRVHLKGHAALSRAAASHWRELSKKTDMPGYGRIINTSSEAFLIGGAGQPNYAAAKAGIVALTLSTSQALSRYGVTANAICPRARTEMTQNVFGEAQSDNDELAPEHVANFVGYLAAPEANTINGEVFIVHGNKITLLESPRVEHEFIADSSSFAPAEIADQIGSYFSSREPQKTYAAWEILNLPQS